MVFDVRSSLPDYRPGGHVPPVREGGPTMIAPRLENPEGSLARSIDVQHRETKGPKIRECDRLLWADGVPRVGRFGGRSYPAPETVDEEAPCILDVASFFTS
eukprot:9520464-Alexandrium_andersonii.AAC.1